MLLGVACSLAIAQSNLGISYGVVFLSSERDVGCDGPLALLLSAPLQTTAHIYIPGQPEKQVIVGSNSITTVPIPCNLFVGYSAPAGLINAGVFVSADDSVLVVPTVYADDNDEPGDSYAAIPVDQWGTSYRIASAGNQIRAAILAASDSTHITIVRGTGTIVEKFTMMHGDVHIVSDQSTTLEATVTSDLPVAVFGGGIDPATFSTDDYSNITEQLLPAYKYGSEAYTMPFGAEPDNLAPVGSKEHLHVGACTGGCTVTLDNIQSFNLATGGFRDVSLTGFHELVAGSGVQLTLRRESCFSNAASDTMCGPRMTLIPTTSQYAPDLYFLTPENRVNGKTPIEHMLDIVCPAADTGSVMLDGLPIGGPWRLIGPSASHAGLRIGVPYGAHHLWGASPMGAIVYGLDAWRGGNPRYDAYAYSPLYAGSVSLRAHLSVQYTATLSCANQLDGSIVITNDGTLPLLVDSLTISGPDAAAFVVTPPALPATLKPFRNWVVPVHFAPTHYGASNATATVYAKGSSNSPFVIPLTGQKDSAAILALPTRIDFGTVASCGQYTRTSVLHNVSVSGVVVSFDAQQGSSRFGLGGAARKMIAPGDSLVVSIIYTPTGDGADSGWVLVHTTLCDSLKIEWRAQCAMPAMEFVDSLKMGDACAADTVRTVAVVRNPSGIAITVNAITTAKPFTVTVVKLPLVIAPHDSAAVTVSFTPVAVGTFSQNIKLTAQPCNLARTAIALGHSGRAVATALGGDFGMFCSDSSSSVVSIRNAGPDTLVITAATATAPFMVDSLQLPVVIAPLDTAHFRVSCNTVAVGTTRGTLSIRGTPCGAKLSVPLTADRTDVRVAMADVDLGSTCGDATLTRSVNAVNAGDTAITITSIAVQSPFTVTSPQTPFTIPPHGTALIAVAFASAQDGAFRSALALSGTPCDAAGLCTLSASRGTIRCVASGDSDFGVVCPGSMAQRSLNLQNLSDNSIVITSSGFTAPFSLVSPALPYALNPHSSTTITVAFAPTAAGQFAAPMTFTGQPCAINAADTLRGASAAPRLTAGGADFGRICFGDSARRTIVVRNTGAVVVTLDSISVSSPFRTVTPLPLTVVPGDSAVLVVAFEPAVAQSFVSSIVLSGSPCGVAAQASLMGSATQTEFFSAEVNVSATHIGVVHDTTIVVHNSGADTIVIRSFMLNGWSAPCPFSLLTPAPVSIAPGDSAVLMIAYAPIVAGSDTADVCLVVDRPCDDSMCVLVTGRAYSGRLYSVALCMSPQPAVSADATIHVPITLSDSVPQSPFSCDVRYDAKLLVFERAASSACDARIAASVPGVAHLRFDPCFALAPGVIGELAFLSLVPNADTAHTQIALQNIVFDSENVTATGCAIPQEIIGPCGLHSGVEFSGAPSLAVYPNPVTTAAVIAVGGPGSERDARLLRIFDVYGREVGQLTDAARAANTVTIELPAGRLAAGMYSAVLNSGGMCVVRTFAVTR